MSVKVIYHSAQISGNEMQEFSEHKLLQNVPVKTCQLHYLSRNFWHRFLKIVEIFLL